MGVLNQRNLQNMVAEPMFYVAKHDFSSIKKRAKSIRWGLYLNFKQVMVILVGPGKTKSCYLKISKSQYLLIFLDVGHVIIIF